MTVPSATAEPPDGRPHRRRRWLLVAVGVVAVVGAGAAWLVFGGDEPRSVTVEEARERTEGSTVSTAPEGQFGPPAAGVYLYEGEGTENTSFPPLTEDQGPTMPSTITPDGEGCWRFRIDYNSHHWQDWRYCGDPSGIVSTGGTTFARREVGTFNADNTSTFTCSENETMLWAGMAVGESREGACTGTSDLMGGSTTSRTRTTYVGDEDIDVGGQTVRARHLRYDNEISGSQEGSEQAHWWVDPLTMLPIRLERDLSVDTTLGTLRITYTEVTSLELTSLTPEARIVEDGSAR
jgi:hypothetical protein